MEVIWSDVALDSLSEILVYVEAYFGKRAAQRIRKEIFAYAETLGFNPHLGKTFFQLSDACEVRYILYKYNRIYYKLYDTYAEIAIVWDGRRDPNKLQDILNGYLDSTQP